MGEAGNTGQANIWALTDLCTPWCIHVAATLRIAEHLEAGVTEIKDLAGAAECDAGALHAVLSYLVGVLRRRRRARGILVDRPRTVARSGEIFEAAGVAGRVTTAGQTFFDPLPAGADLYMLRGILNDWPDAEALAILRRCAEAASP